MGLVTKHHRIWLAVALPLLWAPMLAGFLLRAPAMPDDMPVKWPEALSDWRSFPRDADQWMQQNFGFRAQLLHANAALRHDLRTSTSEHVAYGRGDWLFLTDDAVFQQSMGQRMRVAQVTELADVAAALQRALNSWGGKLVVAAPPNSQSVNRDGLPSWARVPEVATEYDLFARLIRERGIPFVDLRAVLRDEKKREEVYLHTDTHWNNHGMLLGFNAIMDAAGKPGWRIDPQTVETGFFTMPGGDLAHLIGVDGRVHDRQMAVDFSRLKPEPFTNEDLGDRVPMPTYIATRQNAAGPTVMVIGDSFTRGFFLDPLMLHAKRLIWTHHDQCGFKWDLIEKWKPDLVILAPTERYVLCAPDRVPLNMPDGPDKALLEKEAAAPLPAH
ncbi:MAG: hypothetical protein P4L72_06900 [Parvibaculum sp.]|uniref:alginate O-acetyltransferase AlgX-related protein n=1 Tax=Parvibaculum sp. TaxID=2024848 RepID=UPI002842AD03|nr:hypothetical protein [Parvibaculum sp.]MDR3498938.1 hypothetical protein [Parvibaculum sp.]